MPLPETSFTYNTCAITYCVQAPFIVLALVIFMLRPSTRYSPFEFLLFSFYSKRRSVRSHWQHAWASLAINGTMRTQKSMLGNFTSPWKGNNYHYYYLVPTITQPKWNNKRRVLNDRRRRLSNKNTKTCFCFRSGLGFRDNWCDEVFFCPFYFFEFLYEGAGPDVVQPLETKQAMMELMGTHDDGWMVTMRVSTCWPGQRVHTRLVK